MKQDDIEVDTLEARCGHCGEKFDHPDFGELAYGSFIFCGENGRVHAYCHTTDAVARLVEVLLPENCGAEIYQSALAELADPMLGQKLQTAIRCPKCASSNLDYWGGKKTGSMWVKPAGYSNLLSLTRRDIIKRISDFAKEFDAYGPWPDPEISTFDPNGIMVPPWVKYPNLPKGSMGWRMGQGEWYIEDFYRWYYSNPRKRRVEIMSTYKEPEEWKGFYKRHK